MRCRRTYVLNNIHLSPNILISKTSSFVVLQYQGIKKSHKTSARKIIFLQNSIIQL